MNNRFLKIFLIAFLITQGTAFALSIHPVSLTPFFKPQAPKHTRVSFPHQDPPVSAPSKHAPAKRYNLLLENLVSEREKYNAIRVSS